MINFTVPGHPQGKARARTFFNERAGKVCSMTPEKTANYENLVKIAAKQAAGEFYASEQIVLLVKAYYGIPKSTSKKQRELMLCGEVRPTKKPDADNVLKIIADALNGVCYRDDTQIVRATVEKWYGEIPCVEVSLNTV